MPAQRDPIETRDYRAVVPTNLRDPAFFGQMGETVQDAFVEGLRRFFSRTDIRTGAWQREMPSIRKYQTAVPAGGQAYPTAEQLIEEYADLSEKMPHVAVLAVSGPNDPRCVGRVTFGPTQLAPRLTSGPEPFAFGAPRAEVWTAVVAIPGGGGQAAIEVAGEILSVTVGAGTSSAATARELVSQLRNSPVNEFVRIDHDEGSATFTLTYREAGVAFTASGRSNVEATLTTAAIAGDVSVLAYQTAPDGGVIESQVAFDPSRYPAAETPTATSAARAATIWNEQARHSRARVVVRSATNRVEIRSFPYTPNEVEVLAGSTRAAVTALGFGSFANAAAGDAITGDAPNLTYTLGTGTFPADAVGRYLTLAGTALNDGRFLITARPTPGSIVFTSEEGVPEVPPTGGASEWFIGARDDWTNPARPIQNTYVIAWKPTVTIVVMAEKPTERLELADLVWSWATFFMEEQFFMLLGRGVVDDDFPDEQYQISFELAGASRGQPNESPRPGGTLKDKIHELQISIPCSAEWTLPRPVTAAFGPAAGQSWTVRELVEDETIPSSS